MTTVALWHLAVTAVLAGALSSVILVQSLTDALRRVRPRASRTVQAPVPARRAAEPRPVPAGARRDEPAPALAGAAR